MTPAGNQSGTARVLLVDDHAVVRDGIRSMLEQSGEYEVIEAADCQAAYQGFCTESPDVVVTDLSMPGRGGLWLIERIRARSKSVPILVLSMHMDSVFARRTLQAGANGFVSKNSAGRDLMAGIRKLLDGGMFIDPATATTVATDCIQTGPELLDRLSPREFEVFRAIAEGGSTREIAEEYALSVNTVGNHRRSIYRKLGVSTSGEIVRLAIRHRIVHP